MLPLTLIAIFVLTLAIIWWVNKDKGKQIPGPRGIPILGNILQLANQAQHLKFSEWANIYGDIFKVQLGSWQTIVISDGKLLKEMYMDPAFTGKKGFESLQMYKEPLGIFLVDGTHWEFHRRFLLRQLRDFGFGKTTMEQLIIGEVNETILRLSKMQKENNQVSDVKQIVYIATVNSLMSIVASTRYEHDDPKYLEILKNTEKVAKEMTNNLLTMLFPWMKYILPKNKFFEQFNEKNKKIFKEIVNEHKATFQDGTIRDFIDVFLNEIKANENNVESNFHGEHAEKQLIVTLADLYAAGSDSTASTITWGVIYLAKYKNIQGKFQEEIREVTEGNMRQVSVNDMSNMPYTMALIDEILRHSTPIPLSSTHSTTKRINFKGYEVPKDTWIIPNLYHIHHNPKTWGDPENFRPERFLAEDENGVVSYKKSDKMLAFSIGKRQCAGESLARMSLLLFLTNIFQKFSISFVSNRPEPSLVPKPSFVLTPDPFSIVLEERI